MKILILGADGYIGWPLTLDLLRKGHEVSGIDNYQRREIIEGFGGSSLTPIRSPVERRTYLKTKFENFQGWMRINLGENGPSFINMALREFTPDVIIHLAEQPSAPWSMRSVEYSRDTQLKNTIGTLDLLWAMQDICPNAHLIKIGTMGEYGTPNCDIPEGLIPYDCLSPTDYHKCPMHNLIFPRQPGSFYHLSKVHDTYNIKFACDTWNLRSTDIMQGILFGISVTGDETEEELTRFDYDQYFGTALNRFCVQALCDHPLTIYGNGSQTRGYLPLKDSIQCLNIAIENIPEKGEYRTWNQFESIRSINELADIVMHELYDLDGTSAKAIKISNPRIEASNHYYNPQHQTLFDLGYKPTEDILGEIRQMLKSLMPYKDRINKNVILPTTTWQK